MASEKQRAAARRNIKKASAAAKQKRTIAHLPKATRSALGKEGAKARAKKLTANTNAKSVGAVIVAAGSGTRMAGADKLFIEIADRPLLAHAIAPFQECVSIERIVLVMMPLNLKRGRELVEQYGFSKVAALVTGGERRQDSVRLGLEALGSCDYVAVHDGARPLVMPELIERGLEAARETGAAAPAVPLADTVKEAGADGIVVRTLDRSRLWAVQTPQVFRYELLARAHREVTVDVTDDAAMVEALGEAVRLCEGDRRNVKVTAAADLEVVEALLTSGVRAPSG